MKRKTTAAILSIPLTGFVLLTSGCDELINLLDPRFSFNHDPRPFVTIINAEDPTNGKLIRVEFNQFGTGYKVYQSNIRIPGPRTGTMPRDVKHGGGTLDPDPDEHFMCPDLWPDPDDEFPLPDPPLPMPDYPDEDPFDGLPEPPPFDPDDLEFTNLSDGTETIVDAGGTDNAAPRNTPESASLGTINLGALPAGVGTNADESLTLVAMNGDDSVRIIQNRTVVGSIMLPGGTQPYGIAVSQDGTRAYVTSFTRNAGALLALDVPNRRVIATVPIGNFPAQVAFSPDESQVWATAFFDDSVYIIDTLTNTLATRVTGLFNAWGIAFNPNGTRAYVTGATDSAGTLYVIDTSAYKVIATVGVGDRPRWVRVSNTGRHVFVVNHNSNFVSQVDARTNKLIRNIVVGPQAESFRFVK
jgi:YVTN family beta-propeller protein